MLQLISDILDLSKIEAGTLEFQYSDIELNTELKKLESTLKLKLKSDDVQLEFVPGLPVCPVCTEKNRLSQLIINLVTNAIKYSLEQASIRIFITEEEQFYKIHVKDTGMGITREDFPRIFERFYRVDKARSRAMGGTGLGLAIAKEIIKQHNGFIWAKSEYGKGSTFTIVLPYDKDAIRDDGWDNEDE